MTSLSVTFLRARTSLGIETLLNNNIGGNNVAVGAFAGLNVNGQGVICIGSGAGNFNTSGDDNIYLGNEGVGVESHTIRIGSGFASNHTRIFLAATRGVTTGQANAIPVLIDGAGQVGTASSSRRFKHDIKPMDGTSEAILALKPVTFHYKSDETNTSQFGLIAEEVAQVNPDLVVHDKNGEVYTVRYDAVNAMLLNEFLKEHRTVQELKSTVAKQEATIAQQQTSFQSKLAEQERQIAALTVGLQKVSAQIELNDPSPQTVRNYH